MTLSKGMIMSMHLGGPLVLMGKLDRQEFHLLPKFQIFCTNFTADVRPANDATFIENYLHHKLRILVKVSSVLVAN